MDKIVRTAKLALPKVEEYIDMTTHCSMMNVSEILSILLVAISTELDKRLDTIVGTILDR